MKSFEKYVEDFLWDSRLVVMPGLIASVFGAFGLFYIATVDVFYTISSHKDEIC